MTLVIDSFRKLLPARAKSNPSGWTSFNAPCCQHRGHSPDSRKRGGIKFADGIVFNCFNCKFTASWQPGRGLSEKFKSLCRWLGANEDMIKDLVFEALKTESPEYKPESFKPKVEFTKKDLPEGSLRLLDWINTDLPSDIEEKIAEVIMYLESRGQDPLSGDFYWSPLGGFDKRVTIPFTYKNEIVGYTARRVDKGKPKYLSDHHNGFVFNVDNQKEEQRYLFVVEGPFDALQINGVALLTNDINDTQARIINSLGHEIIVIPDQDQAGVNLLDRAAELGWSVAFPNWEDDVKDVSDAVAKYGKLFVAVDAIKTAQQGQIKINVAKNHLIQKLERIEYEENN